MQEGGTSGAARVVAVVTHLNLEVMKNSSEAEKKVDFSWLVNVPFQPNWAGFAGYEKLGGERLTKSVEALEELMVTAMQDRLSGKTPNKQVCIAICNNCIMHGIHKQS